MSSHSHEPHFVLIPLMTQGHLIPMVDIAKLLAQRKVTATIITTPQNIVRFNSIVDRAVESGLPIRVLQVSFPGTEVGLPEGCETVDSLPSPDLMTNFFAAITLLQEPVEKLLEELNPKPTCLVSDKHLAWSADTAAKFCLPRLLFDGTSCFNLLCNHALRESKAHEVVPESDTFVVAGLPDHVELRKTQLPGAFNPGSNVDLQIIRERVRESEAGAYGVLVNSFEELEPEYVKGYQKKTGNKVWCIGPVSLCNKDRLDLAERGNNKALTNADQFLKWLDSWAPNSVLYACLGSLNRLTPQQLIELGLGLEATKRPFIWVIRGRYKREETEKWLKEDGFEERNKERGLMIWGWAPQVLILSHPSIGGFLTHCGWNSTLEGICAGVPMVTWPLFAEQFLNEKLVVEVLKVGVRVGAEVVVHLGEEEKFGVMVKRENVRDAVGKVMGGGEEGEERRERVKTLKEMAEKTVDKGGSSWLNISLLIQDITQNRNN